MFDSVLCTYIPHVNVMAILTCAAEKYIFHKVHAADVYQLKGNQMTVFNFLLGH